MRIHTLHVFLLGLITLFPISSMHPAQQPFAAPQMPVSAHYASVAAQLNANMSVESSPARMARYFPEALDGFIALRIDETSIQQLDSLLGLALRPFAQTVPQLSLRDLLQVSTNQSLDDLLSWLGNNAAVGISVAQRSLNVMAVIELDDVDAALAFIRSSFPFLTEQSLSDYTIFGAEGVAVEFIEGRMVITSGSAGIGEFPATDVLLDDEAFQQAITSLPESDYTSIVYIGSDWPYQLSYSIFGSQQVLEQQLFQSGIASPGSLRAAPLAIGLTVLDGVTYTIDTAQLPLEPTNRPAVINPDFLRFVPADAEAVIHASNLAALYGSFAATINDANQALYSSQGRTVQPGFISQFENAVRQLLGIDLSADFLSWADGDYAIVAYADVMTIAEGAARGRLDISDRYDIGIIIQPSDLAAAQSFVVQLGRNLLRMAIPGVSVTERQPGDVSGTQITVTIPSFPNPMTLEFIMGVTEDVFFLATPRLAQSIAEGGSSLADRDDYQNARQYLLPEPTSIWYISGEGLILGGVANPVSFILGLAFLGPAVVTVFAPDADGNWVLLPTPTPEPTPDPASIVQTLQWLMDSIRAASVSSTVTEDGVTLIRLTLTVQRSD